MSKEFRSELSIVMINEANVASLYFVSCKVLVSLVQVIISLFLVQHASRMLRPVCVHVFVVVCVIALFDQPTVVESAVMRVHPSIQIDDGKYCTSNNESSLCHKANSFERIISTSLDRV